MIFACSGIPLPRGTARLHLTRFVTSAHLVKEFKRYRNRDDKLRAVLGGPLLQDARFLGMIYEFYDHGDTIVRYRFLPLELLGERLEHFGTFW